MDALAETLSPTVPKPDHVPHAAVYDFDMFRDPRLLHDPHERIRQMLSEAPSVFWTPRNGGHWMVIGHQENYLASRDTENFSSELMPAAHVAGMMAMLPPGIDRLPTPTPINLDPPLHTIFRAPLQAAFSPKAMLAAGAGVFENDEATAGALRGISPVGA